jgi:hypothetical protein
MRALSLWEQRRQPVASMCATVRGERRMNFEEELSSARTAVEELARAGNLPAGVMSTLEDIFRLIDALAVSSKASFDHFERELAALQSGLHRVQGTTSVNGADAQALRTEMHAADRLDQGLDQRVSLIAQRVTALEAEAEAARRHVSGKSPTHS